MSSPCVNSPWCIRLAGVEDIPVIQEIVVWHGQWRLAISYPKRFWIMN
jgi:hypothetical protein